MNPCEHLADQYRRALEGGAWHGPSWKELLADVTREEALAHPVPGAHSIAEIVLHAITWHDVVRLRLGGESPQVSADEDWPRARVSDDAAWAATTNRLRSSGRALQEAVAAFPPERLHDRRPGLEDTWYGMIIGELHHVLYHAGQIPILRKARPASP